MKRTDEGYWEWRKKVGKPKAIKDPETLWQLACDYFQNADENKLEKVDFLKGGPKAGSLVRIPLDVPYTWDGFEAYLMERGIISKLDDYKANSNDAYSEFQDIVRAISKIIFSRNFNGAAVGAFTPNLIARQLGLAEKTEMKVQAEQALFGDDED